MNINNVERVMRCYLEPHRYWHGLQHPMTMIQWGGSYLTRAQFWAIWYHDAIWNPLALDNEKQSADLFVSDLDDELTPDEVRTGEQIIYDTQEHEPHIDQSRLVLDLDIYAMAQAPDRYHQYAADIRAEFAMVPWETYREKRLEFLRKMLNREKLFFTDMFKGLESMAQENIRREIPQLELGPR